MVKGYWRASYQDAKHQKSRKGHRGSSTRKYKFWGSSCYLKKTHWLFFFLKNISWHGFDLIFDLWLQSYFEKEGVKELFVYLLGWRISKNIYSTRGLIEEGEGDFLIKMRKTG